MAQAAAALGIDIGGTFCRAALISAQGRVLSLRRAATPPRGAPAGLAQLLTELAAGVLADRREVVEPAGVALPGVRDDSGDVLLRANNLPALVGVNVRSLLEGALRRPVRLEADVVAAGWAQWLHCRPRPQHFAYVSVGTGVGACVIEKGRCQPAVAAGGARFCDALVEDSRGAAGGLEAVVRRELAAVVRDAGALRHVARAIASALRQLPSASGFDVIALGGGVVEHTPGLVPEVQSQLAGCRVIGGPLSSNVAGVVGAAMLVLGAE